MGIYGESGCGKTTLVDLLSGFLKPSAGDIFCDDNNINNYEMGWRKLIGYVPQSIFLTDDTIRNNICLGLDEESIDKELLDISIEQSQLKQLVNDLPNGINTSVGDRGINLSLGQIQRIGIARVLYSQKPIILFDESTSSLDINNEKEIIEVIKNLKQKKTIIFISHDIKLLKNCDKIYEISNKKLINSITL